jgi:hypothetical protein
LPASERFDNHVGHFKITCPGEESQLGQVVPICCNGGASLSHHDEDREVAAGVEVRAPPIASSLSFWYSSTRACNAPTSVRSTLTVGDRIKGSWPGGPKRPGDHPPGTRRPRLRTVEEIEAGISARSLRRTRKARSRRIALGLGFLMVAAWGIGWALGKSSHTTVVQLNAERENALRQDLFISKEVNRTLLELWKMEDVQALRNKGLTR